MQKTIIFATWLTVLIFGVYVMAFGSNGFGSGQGYEGSMSRGRVGGYSGTRSSVAGGRDTSELEPTVHMRGGQMFGPTYSDPNTGQTYGTQDLYDRPVAGMQESEGGGFGAALGKLAPYFKKYGLPVALGFLGGGPLGAVLGGAMAAHGINPMSIGTNMAQAVLSQIMPSVFNEPTNLGIFQRSMDPADLAELYADFGGAEAAGVTPGGLGGPTTPEDIQSGWTDMPLSIAAQGLIAPPSEGAPLQEGKVAPQPTQIAARGLMDLSQGELTHAGERKTRNFPTLGIGLGVK